MIELKVLLLLFMPVGEGQAIELWRKRSLFYKSNIRLRFWCCCSHRPCHLHATLRSRDEVVEIFRQQGFDLSSASSKMRLPEKCTSIWKKLIVSNSSVWEFSPNISRKRIFAHTKIPICFSRHAARVCIVAEQALWHYAKIKKGANLMIFAPFPVTKKNVQVCRKWLLSINNVGWQRPSQQSSTVLSGGRHDDPDNRDNKSVPYIELQNWS